MFDVFFFWDFSKKNFQNLSLVHYLLARRDMFFVCVRKNLKEFFWVHW